jgi:UDP-N-acetylglucosamine 2-epimerase (non-hydrolysing)
MPSEENHTGVKRVAVFFGTRPEAIKMAPVVKALDEAPDIDAVVVATGQHREMLQQVVDLFQIEVDHSLDVMRTNQTLASLTARLMQAIDALLGEIECDFCLTQGDTTTTFVASLAAFYRRIPVCHVEAGLRTGNIYSPFPEEVNRRLVSSIAELHFPPTEISRRNLVREGVPDRTIHVTGNTVVDALQLEIKQQRDPAIESEVQGQLASELGEGWWRRPYVLVTGHRRENFGRGFDEICQALAQLSDRFPDYDFIYPVHLNPNVQGPVYERLGSRKSVRLMTPQSYRPFVALMRGCRLVLTDSGGIQEEAPSLGKPVLVMRDTTERPEGVDAGTVKLVGADTTRIVNSVSELLTDDAAYSRMSEAVNPYGDGHASERIVTAVSRFLRRS